MCVKHKKLLSLQRSLFWVLYTQKGIDITSIPTYVSVLPTRA
nr:MAG TPA: hypothetical protein [Bacteriophage sp.]